MANLNISITKEELKKCADIIETLVKGLIAEHQDSLETVTAIADAYSDLKRLLKLGDAK